MAGFIKALILVPLALLVVLLAVANRGPVVISFDPFTPADPLYFVSAPLWIVLFLAVTLGVLVGGVAAWVVQGKHRRLERAYKREARELRRQQERTRERERAGLAAGGVPALPRY